MAEPAPGRIEVSRRSLALSHFFESMRDCQGLEVLDLGEFSQTNRQYVHSAGHRLFSDDLLAKYDAVFGAAPPGSAARDPELAHEFLSQTLQFEPGQFDAVLGWDVFEFVPRPLLDALVARLLSVMRTRGVLLAYFHTDLQAQTVRNYAYHVVAPQTLELHPRGMRRPAQLFPTRSVEKLFDRFGAVKFYLTRDALREVLVRK